MLQKPDWSKLLKPAYFLLQRRVLTILALAGLVLLLAGGRISEFISLRANAAWQQRDLPQGLSRTAVEQIESLVEAKRNRTPAQRKLDSQLWFASKMRRGERIAPAVAKLQTRAEISPEGDTVVDMSVVLGEGLLEALAERGAEILDVVPAYQTIRARVPVDQLESIAALPQVRFVQPKQEGETVGATRSQILQSQKLWDSFTTGSTGHTGKRQTIQPPRDPRAPRGSSREDRVRAELTKALARVSAVKSAAQQLVAEGDVTHKAVNARSAYGINGTGVKIGVISDGVLSLKISQARGALGEVKILPGQGGDGDEGTAMLEIVHALAPGAQLYFATALNGLTRFAQNIRDLRAAGCDIIVDDFIYFVESPFQDGQQGFNGLSNAGAAIQAVNDVTASGAMYFSSAGNSGNLNDGTAGVWEGDFKDGGAAPRPLPSNAGRIHDFGNGRLFNPITSSTGTIFLKWSDPLGGSSNDYDLYVLDNTGTFLTAASINDQLTFPEPFEAVGGQATGGRLVVVKYSGEDRFLQLNTNRGRLGIATSGTIYGHAAAADAFAVAATPAGPRLPPNPSGPYPSAFNFTNKVELFSSDGPRRIFFRADGSPYTPGNSTATGGLLRQKPDITAADGTTVTGVGNFGSPFFGTSAAAPHAAAIAALLKSANPSFTNAQIREAMIKTAIDIEAPGVDRDSGAGIVMAFEAAQALGVTPMANIDLGTIAAAEVTGDGDGRIDPGEKGSLSVQLKNLGVVSAANVTATLTSVTPGVFVESPSSISYGNLASATGAATNTVPFTFSLSSIAACDLTAIFNLTLNYAGGPSPKVLTFEVPTGAPPIAITSTLDAAPPAAGTRYTAVTGLQSARLNRSGFASSCALPNPYPATTGSGTRRFDAYTFGPTCPGNGAPACITVTLTNACNTAGRDLFAAVYLDSFNPNNLGANYLSDMGVSIVGSSNTFSLPVPAGRSFVIVVHEVNSGGGAGCGYTLSVSGLCQACAETKMVCLQDDRSRDYLLFNSLSGDYYFNSCSTNVTFSGKGILDWVNGRLFLNDGTRVRAQFDNNAFGSANRGQAIIRPNPLATTLSIRDSGLSNNLCSCPQ